jgi:hypothetical protein
VLGEPPLPGQTDPDATPMERFETVWTRVVESLAAHRPLWAASSRSSRRSSARRTVREFLANAQQQGRLGLASLLQNIDPAVDQDKAQAVGGFYHALLSGVLVQWLTTRTAPSPGVTWPTRCAQSWPTSVQPTSRHRRPAKLRHPEELT